MSRVRRRPARDERADMDEEVAFVPPPAAVAAATPATTTPGDRKPLKAEESLVSYLRELDLPLRAAASTVTDARTGAHEAGPLLLSRVLSEEARGLLSAIFREVTHREASLATHATGSSSLQAALCAATCSQTVQVVRACTPYLTFLALNRFASHVLQTVLSVSVAYLKGDTAVEEGESVDDLIAALLPWFDCCIASMSQLVFHMCGTHMVRSLIQVGAGQDPNAALPLLLSSHALQVATSSADAFYTRLGPRHASRFMAYLCALVHAMGDADGDFDCDSGVDASGSVAQSDSALLAMTSSPHASPTVQVALRVTATVARGCCDYFNRRLVGAPLTDLDRNSINGVTDLNRIARLTGGVQLARQGGGGGASPPSIGWFQVMTSNAIAARVCEAVLLYSDSNLHAALHEHCVGRLEGMTAHACGNYVIQRLLVTARSVEQAVQVVTRLEPHVASLMDSNRDGVVWHMLAPLLGQRACTTATGGDDTGIIPLYAAQVEPCPEPLQVAVIQRLIATAGGTSHAIPWWLDLNGYRTTRTLTNVTSTSTVSPTGSRILALALRSTPTAASPLLQSLLDLNPAVLASIACDPHVSRHVLEPLTTSHAPQLIAALRGRFAHLSCARFASYLVFKLFTAASFKLKRAMASELVEREVDLNASPSGRQVFKLMRLELFKRNVDSWSSAWTRTDARVAAVTTAMTSTAGRRRGREEQEEQLETVTVTRKKRR